MYIMVNRGSLSAVIRKVGFLCVPEMSGDVVCTVAKLDRQDLMHSWGKLGIISETSEYWIDGEVRES